MEVALRIGSSVVPVFLVIGLGAFLARRLELHLTTLNLLALHVFTPCLVFDAISGRQAGASSLAVLGATVAVSLVCLGLGRWLGLLSGADRPHTASLMGSSAFLNAGNMGLPLVLFAFGPEGLARAAPCFVGMALTINTIGILVYSSGREARLWKNLAQVFRVPVVYAAGLAILLPLAGIELPDVVARPVTLLGQAAIPVLLLSFGIQLGNAGFRMPAPATWGAVALRLVAGPLLGFALALGLMRAGLFDSLDAKVFTLMSGLPPAVYNYLLAERFGGDVRTVSDAILWATLVSFGTLSLLLWLLAQAR